MGTFPMRIDTPRLTLRRFERGDASALLAAFTESEHHLRRWIALPEHPTLADLESRVDRFDEWFRTGHRYHLAVVTRDEGTLVGSVVLHPHPLHESQELTFWLRHDRCGQGFATEAVGAAGEAALLLPGVRRLTILCDRRNFRCAHLAVRLGYARRGGAGDLALWELEATRRRADVMLTR